MTFAVGRSSRRRQPYSAVDSRRGVILLVVMVLLALLSVMGLTLVLVTAQGRLSALAASRKGLQSEHDNSELASAITQVTAGSTDPNSSIGAHSLLEDLYGLPHFFGRVAPGTPVVPIGLTAAGANYLAGGNNGTLVQFAVVAAAPSGAAGLGPQSVSQYVLPQNSGAFCGQVITMLTGRASGQSGRVVGYYYNAAAGLAVLQSSSFGGVVPEAGDEFMINGRPFSGTGFGLDVTKFQGGAPWNVPAFATNGNVPLLSAFETLVPVNGQLATGVPFGTPTPMPYAYLPNHSRIPLSAFLSTGGTYWDPSGPGGANESYDAPDFQNLMLAMHYWSPFLLPASANGGPSQVGVITPIPSLHRPELVAWYYNQAIITANPLISMANPIMRSKVILRPEPTDNYFLDAGPPSGHVGGPNNIWDAREPWHDVNGNGIPDDVYADGTKAFLDLNGDGAWTAGETDYSGNTFNPVTGCWYIAANGGWALDTNAGLDVDNDGDGRHDSIWVDGGLPIHTEADGTLTKNLIGVLCIDLDGKVNINATGTLAQLDPLRYYGNSVSGPLAGVAGSDFLYSDFFERKSPISQGYGTADINPIHLFVRSHTPTAVTPSYTYSSGTTSGAAQALNFYQVFLQGYDGYTATGGAGPLAAVDGRNGESTRLTVPGVFGFPGVYPPGSYANSPSVLTTTQRILSGPRPGASDWFDPFVTAQLASAGSAAYWVNDPVTLARFHDIRPGLLTPPSLSTTPFFFDFLDSYLPGTTTPYLPANAAAPGASHLPTAHGTPSDLHSRGVLTTDLSGHPYYAGTTTFPWQVTGLYQANFQPTPFTNFWQATMIDAPVSQYSTPGSFLQGEVVLDEAVDTQYEMNLTQNAKQGGQNTGNTVSGMVDYSSVDAKIKPSEWEGVLRTWESSASGSANSAGLVQRLNQLETAANYVLTGSTTSVYSLLANKDSSSAFPSTKLSPRDDIRLSATSESWDLPVPNIVLTPRQIQDAVEYINYYSLAGGGSPLVTPGTLNLNNISVADLARLRIFADNYWLPSNQINPNFPLLSLLSGPDLSLFGNLKNIQQAVGTFPAVPVWPLLAPETILGMRLDVNRPLGNGQDDNANGVVDEPNEVFWQDAAGRGEHLLYPFSQVNTNGAGPVGQINGATAQNNLMGILDLNNDGFYPIGIGGTTSIDPQLTFQTGSPPTPIYLPPDPTGADSRARQLLAKQLYCLMMLLLDDRPSYNPALTPPSGPWPYGAAAGTTQYIMAQIFSLTGPTMPIGWPNYALLANAPREQAAYVIAQWAVNVVDFRDRDSIMTPFEFDIYPFRVDPYVPANAAMAGIVAVELNQTWNVDDIIDPIIGTPAPWSHQDDTQAYRGLVWGCERPELLMTETVAFHDRGTADTSQAQNMNSPSSGADTLVNQGGPPTDTDYDQVRRPRGSLIVELFNPTSYWDAPQLDMQTNGLAWQTVWPQQPWNTPDSNGNEGRGVNLAQVAAGQPANNPAGPASSPVWRIVVAYSPWQANESMCYKTPAGATAGVYGGGGYAASPAGLGKQIDPRVPTLPPGAIHRAVYFTPFQQSFITGGGAPATLSAVADTYLNESFFADPDIFPGFVPGAVTNANVGNPASLLLPPGQYALIGPGNQDIAGTGNYYIFAGQNNTASATNSYKWQLQLGNVPSYNTTAYLYGAAGAAAGPYAAGYGTTPATSASIKPVIGVPIQTNWFQNSGGPVYAIHNSAGLAGVSAAGNMAVSTTLRMSVSEPEHGYPIWSGSATTAQPAPLSAASLGYMKDDAMYYTSPGTPSAGVGKFPQHPFDSGQGQPLANSPAYLQFGDLPNPYVAPSTATNTTLGYTVLYLQRLANPLQAWDQNMNPYITVDSMPVDLTAYTGEKSAAGGAEPGTNYTVTGGPNPPTGLPAGTTWTASPGTASSFDTRRRGYDPNPAAAGQTVRTSQGVANVWTPLPTSGTNVYTTAGEWGTNSAGSYTNPMPMSGPYSTTGTLTGSSLGWVNYEYSLGSFYTAGSAGANIGLSGMPAYMYNGDPMSPFPWLTWNNRPYVSQFEVMLVPASSPSTQALDFGMLGWQTEGLSALVPSQYQPGVVASGGVQPWAGLLPIAQFANLLNYFNNNQVGTAVNGVAGTFTPGSMTLMPNLYRIFEFLQVPSRYTGTQEMLDPSQFAGDNSGFVAGLPSASHLFHTPFNWLPRYREPGRVNLNTVFDPVVFQSLMDDYPGTLYANPTTDLNPITGLPDAMLWPRGLWSSLTRSRQGFYEDPARPYQWGAAPQPGPYTVNFAAVPVSNPSAPPNPVSQFAYNTSINKPGMNADVPTYFANPFRPDGAAAFVPPADLTLTPPAPLNYLKLMHQWQYPGGPNNSVNATLLRTQEGAASVPTPPLAPPFTPTAAVSSSEQMTTLEFAGQSSFPMLVNAAGVAVNPTPAPLAQFDDTAFDLNNASATFKPGMGNTTAYRNAGQSAAFQYQMFTRLGNTTTNRSNVYAIWITLGKFEVQSVAVSPQNPDGYKLVKPYVDGAGNQVVTRGFYIFDRSVPMGFQRGQDVNIERGMLVERVLQLPQ